MAGILIVAAAAIFVLGFALGIIALVSAGIRREERAFLRTGKVSITRSAGDPAALAARGVTGLWVRHWDADLPLSAEERAVAQHRDSIVPGHRDSTA
jgi:hypothetical protein